MENAFSREFRLICVENLVMHQGAFRIDRVSFEVGAGEYAVLMGPTGCGKTSVLESVAGLRAVTAGRIILHGDDVTNWTPAARQIGYVPQDGAIFPTMTVFENLAFPLYIRRWKKTDINTRVGELAEWLALKSILERRAIGLSGGESQRIALGRALSFHPRALLLDEPLSALDEETRRRLAAVLRSLHGGAMTVLHVTHHREEALSLCDRLLCFENGKIVDEGLKR